MKFTPTEFHPDALHRYTLTPVLQEYIKCTNPSNRIVIKPSISHSMIPVIYLCIFLLFSNLAVHTLNFYVFFIIHNCYFSFVIFVYIPIYQILMYFHSSNLFVNGTCCAVYMKINVIFCLDDLALMFTSANYYLSHRILCHQNIGSPSQY